MNVKAYLDEITETRKVDYDVVERAFKEGLAKARQAVSIPAKEYAEKAADLVENRSEQEYQRMNHLLTMRGKAAGNATLQQMRKNVSDRRKVVANPQLRLDAIRLLVCR